MDMELKARNTAMRIAGTTPGRPDNLAREKAAIYEEVSHLDQNVESLHNVIETLAERLNPVLGMTNPETDSPERDTYGASKLCHELYNYNTGLNQAISRLYDLLRRVEV